MSRISRCSIGLKKRRRMPHAGLSSSLEFRMIRRSTISSRDRQVSKTPRCRSRSQAEAGPRSCCRCAPLNGRTCVPSWTRFVAHYAPGDTIPLVEIMKGRISLDFDLHEGRFGLFNLRWEVNAREAGKPPREDWLRDWRRTLGHNPAHPSSHLHFNSHPKASSVERSRGLEEPGENDLRLAIGDPNPLAFLLSVAAWVRRNLEVQ